MSEVYQWSPVGDQCASNTTQEAQGQKNCMGNKPKALSLTGQWQIFQEKKKIKIKFAKVLNVSFIN